MMHKQKGRREENMTYTYSKLKGRIIELYGTQRNFAKKLGISQNSLSKKLTCKTEFSQKDIIKWSNLLGINKDEYGEYFFE